MLLGDPTKAKTQVGWVPEMILNAMIEELVAHDLGQARRRALLAQHGYSVAMTQER